MTYEIKDLACRRGDLTVLSGVRFSLTPGEALILRGSNGSGKTTLLRCLAGLTPPVAGEMSFSADDVAYAAHSDGLKAQMSVRESLNFWASIYGTGDIAGAVEGFNLGSLTTRLVGTLSAGQKRRLSLARMMLTGRPIWALDEPTVSLDTDAVALFANAVHRHLKGGGAAIIATHIDLGLPDARVLDVGQFRALPEATLDPFLDEAMS